jgi:hypothetical protein
MVDPVLSSIPCEWKTFDAFLIDVFAKMKKEVE